MLATLFASRGAIMLTAGDEFGRTQRGNNNAYAQDNAIGWIDWQGRDLDLEDFVAALAALRGAHMASFATFPAEGDWQRLPGGKMTTEDWENPATAGFEYRSVDNFHHRSMRFDRVERSADLRMDGSQAVE